MNKYFKLNIYDRNNELLAIRHFNTHLDKHLPGFIKHIFENFEQAKIIDLMCIENNKQEFVAQLNRGEEKFVLNSYATDHMYIFDLLKVPEAPRLDAKEIGSHDFEGSEPADPTDKAGEKPQRPPIGLAKQEHSFGLADITVEMDNGEKFTFETEAGNIVSDDEKVPGFKSVTYLRSRISPFMEQSKQDFKFITDNATGRIYNEIMRSVENLEQAEKFAEELASESNNNFLESTIKQEVLFKVKEEINARIKKLLTEEINPF